jgi:glycosyltransferase involved in cell wall biosynthesis
MIAFIQVFGLRGPAGGPKLLRGLLEAGHPPVLSVTTGHEAAPPPLEAVELQMPLRPHLGRIDRTRFHQKFGILDGVFRSRFERKLRRVFLENQVEAIHVIPHGYNIVSAHRVAQKLNIPLLVSLHDDLEYSTLGHPLRRQILDSMAEAWRSAACIFVISKAIGEEYNRRYGVRDYEVVTDGLKSVANGPRAGRKRSLHIFFMGLFHPGYKANFRAMLDALKLFRRHHPDWDISVTSRSAYIVCPLEEDDVPVKVVQFTPDPADAEKDMANADLLYLPLPFEHFLKDFARFSMSTKMVSYLGSGVPIFYHGPAEAAAGQLLEEHQAATVCTTLDPEAMAGKLEEAVENRATTAEMALELARKQFMLRDQQERFWSLIKAAL